VAEAESAPVDTQKLQQALDTVQQFAGVASKFSKEQKYQFNDIVSNLYRLGEQWKALNLGTTGSDVDDALQEAMEAVNRALSEIYGIDEAVKYVARSINNSIEDAESEAEWARKYPDDK
jgi:ABC-type transporter Mla subunit MlaD